MAQLPPTPAADAAEAEAHDKSPQPPAEPAAAATKGVTLVRAGDDGPWGLARGSRLRNNLLGAVGFLELANAGDFAANVWNQLPVPLFAAVLMGLGGTLAVGMSVVAFVDARRAWRNVGFLRRQRRRLRRGRGRRAPGGHDDDDDAAPAAPADRALDVLLAVVFRELGCEVINRWALDVLMGSGAVLIAAGTYLAIAGGEGDAVFAASNLLSGWIGNTPIALFGLVNSAWAAYMWAKAQAHAAATRRLLPGSRAAGLVRRRSRAVQVFCVINGTASVLGGGASLVTSIYWWGYVVLIPVIVASVFCNQWWRRRVGYTRAELGPAELRPTDLAADLEFAARAGLVLRERRGQPALLGHLVGDPASLPDVLVFADRHALLPDLCVAVAADPKLRDALCGPDASELEMRPGDLLALPPRLHADVVDKAQECLGRVGRRHFGNRERYLAELLGTWCAVVGTLDSDTEDASVEHKSRLDAPCLAADV